MSEVASACHDEAGPEGAQESLEQAVESTISVEAILPHFTVTAFDMEALSAPGERARGTITWPNGVSLVCKARADAGVIAPRLDASGSAVLDLSQCEREVRVLFPLDGLTQLARQLPADAVLSFAVEMTGEPSLLLEAPVQWIWIVARGADGSQYPIRKLGRPDVRRTRDMPFAFGVTLAASEALKPNLCLAIQCAVGETPLVLGGVRVHPRSVGIAGGAFDLDPEGIRFSLPDASLRLALLAPGGEAGLVLPDQEATTGEARLGWGALAPAEVQTAAAAGGDRILAAMAGEACVALARLSAAEVTAANGGGTTPALKGGELLAEVERQFEAGNYRACLAWLDRLSGPDAAQQTKATRLRLSVLSKLRMFEDVASVFEGAPPELRATPLMADRYLEACANEGWIDRGAAALEDWVWDFSPEASQTLAAVAVYFSMLTPAVRQVATARLLSSPEILAKNQRAVIRLAHGCIEEGRHEDFFRLLSLLPKNEGKAPLRLSGLLLRGQLAFTLGCFPAQLAAVNAALGAFGVQAIELIDPQQPLIPANVRSDIAPGTRRGPLVTVLMTAFNSAATILYAARSILMQSYADIELIIIDDGSSDATPLLIDALAASDPRVRSIKLNGNRGTFFAKNEGLLAARGEFVTCQDADDWAHPDKIAVMAERLAREVGLVSTGVQHIRCSPTRGLQCRGSVYTRPDASSFMFRRVPVQERVGFYDCVRAGADTEFVQRVRRAFGADASVYGAELLSIVLWSGGTLSGGGRFRIDEDTGASTPPRNAYRRAYSEWHEATPDLRMRFPPEARPFPVPAALMSGVPAGDAPQ